MTKQEFKDIVNDAVKAGGDRKEVEAYVRAGYKLDADFGKEKDSDDEKEKADDKE